MTAAKAQNCQVKRARGATTLDDAARSSLPARGCSRTTLKRLPIPMMLVEKRGKKLLRTGAKWCELLRTGAKKRKFLAPVSHLIRSGVRTGKSGKKLL